MCREEEKEAIVRAIFNHTTTIGIREQRLNRYVLTREMDTVETPYGRVRRKTVQGYGVKRAKLEYDDLARAAAAHQVSIAEVERAAGEASGKE